MAVEQLLEKAGALLGRSELVDDLTFSRRAYVARLRLGGGETVIVKQPFSTDGFRRELAALRTLPDDVRPALRAIGDNFLVMEDLGCGPSLADLLVGTDARAAEAALLAWAGALGRALNATLRRGVDERPEDLGWAAGELRVLADDLGVPVPAGLEDDVRRVASVLARPGPWLAFCPGDTCPDNNRVGADGSVRLFDFEGSGWRHAALEAAYCRAPFCTCWCISRLPDGLTGRMEAAFLEWLSPSDADAFSDIVAVAAVYYTLSTFNWFRRFVLDNRPVGPPDRAVCTGRPYVYQRLLAVAGLGERLPSLSVLAGQLAARMVERWPDAGALPMYPAFR